MGLYDSLRLNYCESVLVTLDNRNKWDVCLSCVCSFVKKNAYMVPLIQTYRTLSLTDGQANGRIYGGRNVQLIISLKLAAS